MGFRKKRDDLGTIGKFEAVTKTTQDMVISADEIKQQMGLYRYGLQASGRTVLGKNSTIRLLTDAESRMPPKLSDEYSYNNHNKCGHVLWAATQGQDVNVQYCACKCHTAKELRKAIDKLVAGRRTLKRDAVPAD